MALPFFWGISNKVGNISGHKKFVIASLSATWSHVALSDNSHIVGGYLIDIFIGCN
jgi:hypothetical protein